MKELLLALLCLTATMQQHRAIICDITIEAAPMLEENADASPGAAMADRGEIVDDEGCCRLGDASCPRPRR